MVVDFVSRFEAEDGELSFCLKLDGVAGPPDTDVIDVSMSEVPLDLSSSKYLPLFRKAFIIKKLKTIKMAKGRYDVTTEFII